jgi:hypothetical protein
VVHETKELDIEEPDTLVLDSMEHSMMLGQRSSAMISLSGHFFPNLCFLCFQKGAFVYVFFLYVTCLERCLYLVRFPCMLSVICDTHFNVFSIKKLDDFLMNA